MSICKSKGRISYSSAVPFSLIRVLTLLHLPFPPSPSPLPIRSFPILAGPPHPRVNKSSPQLELALALVPHSPFFSLFFLNGCCPVQHRFRVQQSASAFPFSVDVLHFLPAFSASVIPRPVAARSSPSSRRVLLPLYLLRQSRTRKKQFGRLSFFRLLARFGPHHPR
jgi:hypothetical protein